VHFSLDFIFKQPYIWITLRSSEPCAREAANLMLGRMIDEARNQKGCQKGPGQKGCREEEEVATAASR
jgi:hypothetical protein